MKAPEAIQKLIVQIERLENRITELERKHSWLRARVATLLPERRYCPYCKALIHREAQGCSACGKSWGKKADPKEGLPR